MSDLLSPDRVVIPLAATDKHAILAELTRLLVERVGGVYEEILAAVAERESVMSTGIGDGVAIPHARSAAAAELAMVAGVSAAPVALDSIDGRPAQLFFLIVGPEAAAGPHVKVLSRIARIVRHADVRRALIGARTGEEFCHILAEAETR